MHVAVEHQGGGPETVGVLHQENGLMYCLAAAIVTNNPKMAMHAAEDIKAQLVSRL